MKKSIYRENGYDNRDYYLKCLSDDYNIELDVVQTLADLLGEDEDFDGLVIAVQDVSEGFL